MIFIDHCTDSKGKADGRIKASIVHKYALLLHLKDSTSWPTLLRTADVTKLHPRNLNQDRGER